LGVKGERRGILEMRRHFASYFKSLPDFRELRIRLLTSLDTQEIEGILDQIVAIYRPH
jgi:tRNA-dihydrouridine synthase B